MFWSSPSGPMRRSMPCSATDLVILQYGLNIMQPGVRSFSRYSEQIEKMIAYTRQCFPHAAILVMSVSDRSVKSDDGFVPMDSAPYMIQAQRRAAERTGAAFWSAYDAMQSLGGMARLVENGWAGKDYTHINFAGGRRVAWALLRCDQPRCRGAQVHRARSGTRTSSTPTRHSFRSCFLRSPRCSPHPLNSDDADGDPTGGPYR